MVDTGLSAMTAENRSNNVDIAKQTGRTIVMVKSEQFELGAEEIWDEIRRSRICKRLNRMRKVLEYKECPR